MPPKRTVIRNGIVYKVRSDKVEIPDFDTMSDIAAAMWILRNTYPRGHSRTAKPNLSGLADAISLETR